MQKWEYLSVYFMSEKVKDYLSPRPRFVNRQELWDWKKGPLMHEYCNQLGEEGWELISLHWYSSLAADAIFKRPKPSSQE